MIVVIDLELNLKIYESASIPFTGLQSGQLGVHLEDGSFGEVLKQVVVVVPLGS